MFTGGYDLAFDPWPYKDGSVRLWSCQSFQLPVRWGWASTEVKLRQAVCLAITRAMKTNLNGCGSEINRRGNAGFGPCFHLPGFHFGYLFVTYSQRFSCGDLDVLAVIFPSHHRAAQGHSVGTGAEPAKIPWQASRRRARFFYCKRANEMCRLKLLQAKSQ